MRRFKIRRVQILAVENERPSSYFKKVQFAYVLGSNKAGGVYLMHGGESKPGEVAYIVSKTPTMAGGALWFSKRALRFTGKARRKAKG